MKRRALWLFVALVVGAVTTYAVVDPLLESQWHLKGPADEVAGANVRSVWPIVRGAGVTIGIVDDGLQWTHPDLNANYSAALSYDFNGNDPDPSPTSSNRHGTAVAGVAAAVGDNGIGVSGAAPGSTLAGLRLIAAATSDLDEANALGHQPHAIDILNNSWGPSDSGTVIDGPGPLTRAAIEDAAVDGRGGRGRLFVWAAGNGLFNNDNCNFDGYANNRFVFAVAALSDNGNQAGYSEPCSAMFVTAPSSGGPRGITTTDLVGGSGYSTTDYTSTFGGTSSAAPLVSGVLALMLSQNPDLTRRDTEYILASSSVQIHPADPGWTTGPYPHNEKFGFGLVDAGAAVSAAASWTPVGPELITPLFSRSLNIAIPDNNATGVTDSVVLDNSFAGFYVERVEVEFDATHQWRGDLEVTLTSPQGVASKLATVRAGDSGTQFPNWRFGSVRHWGESAVGIWTLRVADRIGDLTGTWHGWTLRLYGTQGCIFTIAPPSAAFGAPGGNGSATMSTTPECAWTATSNASWLTITGGATGSGNGTIDYSVAANNTSSNRSASITSGGQIHEVTQSGVAANSVTVVTPNGGERAYTGSELYIDWTAVENTTINHFDVLVSVANAAFVPIGGCTNLPASARRCVWGSPSPVASKVIAKVVATDTYGNTAEDVSNATFRIIAGTASISLTAPKAGTNMGIGSQQLIKWSHNLGAQSFALIEISRDAGATWSVIQSALQNSNSTTSFLWSVTGPPSPSVQFRVSWTGGGASTTGPVMTVAPAFVTVKKPNTNLMWGIGTSQKITWQHNLGAGSLMRVDLSRDGGATWTTIAASVANTTAMAGNHTWQVTGPATNAARIRAVWIAVPAVSDTSNVSFMITP